MTTTTRENKQYNIRTESARLKAMIAHVRVEEMCNYRYSLSMNMEQQQFQNTITLRSETDSESKYLHSRVYFHKVFTQCTITTAYVKNNKMMQ